MSIDLGKLAREAQERASEDPRQVAPELCWTKDARGFVAGKKARALTKSRWGVRPERVVCRPGYCGIYIHGYGEERGISWLAYLNGDVTPRGEAFLGHLEKLCSLVGLSCKRNGSPPEAGRRARIEANGRPKRPPAIWPFTVETGRFHAYPGYWVVILEGPGNGKKRVLQYRALADGSVAPGLSAGRFWRARGEMCWSREGGKRQPPRDAEWQTLGAVERRETYRFDRIEAATAAGQLIYFLEGERDVETAETLDLVADTNPGGAGKLTARQAEPYDGARVVVIPDNDAAGLAGAKRTARTLAEAGARVRVLEPLGGELGSGFDFSDWVESYRRREPETWREALLGELRRRVEEATGDRAGEPKPRSVEIREFLATDLKPREWILEHLLQEKDIAMIYARRGVGKTYAAQAIAWAVATGAGWLRFEVKKPTGVLYVDGEMPREDLQSRFRAIARGSEGKLVRPLRLLSEDIDDETLPSLATADGQRLIERELDQFPEIGLLVIDAVTTLCHDATASESDSKSWDSMQAWLLSLRRRGIATLVLHHSGKTGDQRGTSKREDVMTQVLRLERPQDYRPEEGARFELHFVKARGVLGEAARPMEVELRSGPEGELEWSYSDLEGTKRARAFRMFDEGLKASEVSEELDVSRATAFRWQKEWRSEGGVFATV